MLLIFALVAIVRPIVVDARALQRDGWMMLLTTLAFIGVAVVLDEISRITGAVFLAALIGYVLFAYLSERKSGPDARIHEAEVDLHGPAPTPLWQSAGFALIGLVMLVSCAGVRKSCLRRRDHARDSVVTGVIIRAAPNRPLNAQLSSVPRTIAKLGIE